MKYTSVIAIVALFASEASARSLNQYNQNTLAQVSSKDLDSVVNDDMFLQMTNGKVIEVKQGWTGYHPKYHEFPGTVNEFGNFMDPYERTLPERFTGDEAIDSYPVDKFTQNLIKNYAVEGVDGMKVKSPKPNG